MFHVHLHVDGVLGISQVKAKLYITSLDEKKLFFIKSDERDSDHYR